MLLYIIENISHNTIGFFFLKDHVSILGIIAIFVGRQSLIYDGDSL